MTAPEPEDRRGDKLAAVVGFASCLCGFWVSGVLAGTGGVFTGLAVVVLLASFATFLLIFSFARQQSA